VSAADDYPQLAGWHEASEPAKALAEIDHLRTIAALAYEINCAVWHNSDGCLTWDDYDGSLKKLRNYLSGTVCQCNDCDEVTR